MALTVLFRVRLRFRPAYPFYPSGAKIQTSFGTAGSRRVASFLTALVRRFEGPISLGCSEHPGEHASAPDAVLVVL